MTVYTNWRKDAACRDVDPELFFPISTTGAGLRQIDEAKRICRVCPAQIQCLAWALENGVTDGVWGATTEGERRAIRSLMSAFGASAPGPHTAATIAPGNAATGTITFPIDGRLGWTGETEER